MFLTFKTSIMISFQTPLRSITQFEVVTVVHWWRSHFVGTLAEKNSVFEIKAICIRWAFIVCVCERERGRECVRVSVCV